MGGALATWLLLLAGAAVAFLLFQFVHLSVVLAWEDRKTAGLGYFGLPAEGRARFRRTLRRHARLLRPILRLLRRASGFDFRRASFRHRGIAGPRGTCSEESFARGAAYEPRPEDVFVVTQMRSGTTWMQHLVYEVLHRGAGNLPESGTALYAVSAWLEARKSVPVEEAPLLGAERPSRVIKTHFPAPLCPHGPGAKFVYVARHPVSCLASCADFLAENAGALAPPLERVEAWFRSEDMWWGPWPAHVAGWWGRGREGDVLYVRFEEMKEDLATVARRVAEFLGLRPLAEEELGRVVRRCGFGFMREHRETFEMHPPHLLAIEAELIAKGTADRHRDVPPAMRERVLRWCAEELQGTDVPVERLYPDLAAAARAGPAAS